MPDEVVEREVSEVEEDLSTGAWDRGHGHLRDAERDNRELVRRPCRAVHDNRAPLGKARCFDAICRLAHVAQLRCVGDRRPAPARATCSAGHSAPASLALVRQACRACSTGHGWRGSGQLARYAGASTAMKRAPSAAARLRWTGPVPIRIERAGSSSMGPRERERQPRERWPAPAGRRAAGVRADGALHGSVDRGREASEVGRECLRRAAGPPVEQQVRRVTVALRERAFPAGAAQGRGRDEHAGSRPAVRRWTAREVDGFHAGEPLVGRPAARARGPCASARSARARRGDGAPAGAAHPGSGARRTASSMRSTRLTWACASGVSSHTHRAGSPWRFAVSITWLRAARVR